jgi:hypothetical protein
LARAAPSARHQPRRVGDRETIAQGAGDRHAEARARRRHAQVAAGRDGEPAADTEAFDHGERRHRQRLERAHIGLHPLLVGNAVVARCEGEELGDIGPGHERLAAGAAEHDDAHGVIVAQAGADLAQLLVHAPRHGVARIRAVEHHPGDRAVAHKTDFSFAHEILTSSARCGRSMEWRRAAAISPG